MHLSPALAWCMRLWGCFVAVVLLACSSSGGPTPGHYLFHCSMEQLVEIAQQLIALPKGILAADESTSTVGKRLSSINVDNTEASRTALRHLLFTTPDIEQYISGVILYEETLFQQGPDGKQLVDQLTSRGILLGIKVDIGLAQLPSSPDESFTQGLDNLKARCLHYKEAGASFAKWRAVINIRTSNSGPVLPSEAAIAAAARGLAMYAAICQSAGLVPIVEPEVLSDGDHDISVCEAVTQRVLAAVFKALHDDQVLLEGILLKPNMVLPGSSSRSSRSPQEVAAATLRVLHRTVPPAVPGIVFLSGGQSEQEATEHLALVNQQPGPKPWALSFSYGRALQASALKAWLGKEASVQAAQQAFLARAAANSAAVQGKLEATVTS
eukprot:GHRR01009037.1.p1 GENE.GHRR01009037.1~~GHRR01009037.1.p1  ORF type:complete len:383 (+),score=142.26 GHRR01009037.1:277-1425(+)